MNDRPVSVVLSALESLTGRKPRRNGSAWKGHCPAHDDKRPSLTVSEGDDGRALLHCHAGCTVEAIVKALGLTLRDLMPTRVSPPPRPAARRASSGSGDAGGQKTFKSAAEAVAELEHRHGTRSAWWTYTDAKGEPVGVVVRWDRSGGGKDIRPVSRTPAGWIIGGMPTPRPLYRLPTLADAQRVYIVEGEKVADAVGSVGLIGTTSPHGSQGASSADWSPLAGKLCVILPDNDDPGREYGDDVAAILAKLTPTPTVKVIELPHLAPSGDAVDYIAARRAAGLNDDAIRTELERLADAAPAVELDAPGLAVEAFQPFPTDVLPEPARSFVRMSAKAIGCDPSYVALPLLAELAAAIGNTRRIQLKRGWTEPAIVWTAIVGESGTLKTPAFKLVMKPIRDRQGDALKRHAEALASYDAEALRYEKELAAWKRAKAGDDDPPEKPQPPQAVRHVMSDTTVEALAPILLANPRGVLLARDELAGWIRSFDAYKSGRGGDAQHWLSMHNGESVIVDRKGSGTIYVPSAAVSITGGVQPGILDRVLGCEHREGGLLARLLLAMPPRRPKRWTDAEIPASAEATIRVIFDRLYALQPDHGDDGDPRPRIVKLTPKGKATWIDFYNAHAEEHADLTGDLSAAWSKLEGYAARLALVVHFVRRAAGDPTLQNPDAVDETSIAAGVTLSRWFGHEARRVYGILAESDEDRDRRRLVELIHGRGGAVSVRDWQRARSHKTARDAEAELNELVEAGYGRWVQPAPGPRGGRPAKGFVLAFDGTDTDKTPASGAETGVLSESEVSDGPDDIPTVDDADAGCPVDEQVPDDVRFAHVPEAGGVDDDDWGEV